METLRFDLKIFCFDKNIKNARYEEKIIKSIRIETIFAWIAPLGLKKIAQLDKKIEVEIIAEIYVRHNVQPQIIDYYF